METWRLILSGANEAYFNMALDEALLFSCRKNLSPPVLRLYEWRPPAVSIGYFQSAARTVDLRKCTREGMGVVRRITGGRAVLHEDEVTYSVCASTSDFPQLGNSVSQTYQKLSMALLHSLAVLGIDGEWVRPSGEARPTPLPVTSAKPCFISNSRYEITVAGRKLIGSAQRRFSVWSGQKQKRSFLQHGSILTGKGNHSLAELLPDRSLIETLRRDLLNRSTNLESILKRKVSAEEIASALRLGFEKIFDCRIEESVISRRELELARILSRKKYADKRWNLRR